MALFSLKSKCPEHRDSLTSPPPSIHPSIRPEYIGLKQFSFSPSLWLCSSLSLSLSRCVSIYRPVWFFVWILCCPCRQIFCLSVCKSSKINVSVYGSARLIELPLHLRIRRLSPKIETNLLRIYITNSTLRFSKFAGILAGFSIDSCGICWYDWSIALLNNVLMPDEVGRNLVNSNYVII